MVLRSRGPSEPIIPQGFCWGSAWLMPGLEGKFTGESVWVDDFSRGLIQRLIGICSLRLETSLWEWGALFSFRSRKRPIPGLLLLFSLFARGWAPGRLQSHSRCSTAARGYSTVVRMNQGLQTAHGAASPPGRRGKRGNWNLFILFYLIITLGCQESSWMNVSFGPETKLSWSNCER